MDNDSSINGKKKMLFALGLTDEDPAPDDLDEREDFSTSDRTKRNLAAMLRNLDRRED